MKPAAQANFIEVDPKTKRVLKDDLDFYAVNPLGLVPSCGPTTASR